MLLAYEVLSTNIIFHAFWFHFGFHLFGFVFFIDDCNSLRHRSVSIVNTKRTRHITYMFGLVLTLEMIDQKEATPIVINILHISCAR